MAFCPNLSDPNIKKEFNALVEKYGENRAYFMWDFNERAKAKAEETKATPKTINKDKALNWLTERFGENAIQFYENAQAIGDGKIHGYVENASLYLWTQAEVGTEYHEAYHLVFRTMLSNDQRAGLYQEAASKFGEPTDNELADIRKQFPDLSDEDARNLVLEEKMAEEFKEYVLTEEESGKTLPGKIANWFKNLFNWIKALFSDNLSLKQTYSLISSNKMSSSLLGRGVFRNAEKFQGYNKAYLFREDYNDSDFEEVKSTLYTTFLDDKASKGKSYNLANALGISGDKGYLAAGFVKNLYETNDGKKLSEKDAVALFDIESAIMSAPMQNRAAMFNQQFLPKLSELNAKPALGNNPALRAIYYDIYKNWNTTIEAETGNVQTYGWREILEHKLQDNGYTVVNSKETNNIDLQETELSAEESQEIEGLTEQGDVHVERIFGKSSLEDSPSKRLTGRVKELLSKVRSSSTNKFGVKTFIDKDVVYKELLEVFSGKESFNDMVRSLKANAIYKPDVLNPIVEFVDALSPMEKAMIFNAFALVTTEFLLLKTQTDKQGRTFVQIFNPNRKSKAEKVVDSWRKQVISTSNKDRGLYTVEYEIGENDTRTEKIILKNEKLVEARETYKKLDDYIKANLGKNSMNMDFVSYTKGEVHPAAKLIGDLMWSMGLNIGSDVNIEDTYDYVNRALAFGVVNERGTKLRGMPAIKEMQRTLNKIGANLSKTSNYISNNKAAAFQLAEMFTPMLSIAGESFVGADNKARYATNIQSHLTEIFLNAKENPQEFLDRYFKDEFINTYGVEKYQSILFRTLKNSAEFRSIFNVYDLDAIKEGERDIDTITYEDFSRIDSVVVRLNEFINGGKEDSTYIGIPVQADRSKYSVSTSPRLATVGTKYNLTNTSFHELIIAQIVQDFIRVNKAKKDLIEAANTKDNTFIYEGYHTDSNGNIYDKDGNFAGNAFNPDFFQITATDENGNKIVTDEKLTSLGDDPLNQKTISDVIEKYVKGEGLTESQRRDVEQRLNSMASKTISFFERRAQKLKLSLELTDQMERVAWASMPGIKVDDIVKTFVMEEALMRNELVKLLRGSRAYTKNLEDFYKRMAHLTTPGSKYALKKDGLGSAPWLNGEAYGMIDSYNEVTLADLKLNLDTAQTGRVEQNAANLRDGMLAAGFSQEDADAVYNAFLPGEYDSTDAQAFISIDMFRYLSQGEGQWGEEEEMAYRAYKNGGTFSFQPGFVKKGFKAGDAVPTKAIKTYYESLENSNGSLIPISEKNSYNVLLREYTATFPNMEDLRQRMESEGTYAGMKPIHVANFKSAKKLVKRNVYKVTGVIGDYKNLSDNLVNSNDSKGLRRPQTIPDMKDNPVVTLNRQIKKNMLANVENGTNYALNAGLEYQQDITGEQLKDLMHGAIEEKLSRDIDSVLDTLKIPNLDVTKISPEQRLDILKATRDIVLDQIIDKDLHSNYIKALNIKKGEDGLPKFEMPLDLPVYGAKYESIIMSILNNRVFKQSVSGYEGVQIAQIGGHAIDNELKFYTIADDTNGKKRLVHAEIMIREDIARKFGVNPGDSLDNFPEELRRLIGYRIPNQDKASTVIVKIKALLPANYEKAVAVPGQFVKLMGSDFDVDKLFLMFPELENVNGQMRKIVPPYLSLANKEMGLNDPSISYKMLNNIILDCMEAVMANPAHFKETLSPLDDLKDEAARIRRAIPELASAKNWNDYESETDALVRNQAGNKLRGIYANIIAGMNVAQHGTININKRYAIKIDGSTYETFTSRTKTGETKDKAGSLFLSSAVDAGKDPVQKELNDTIITSKVRALFLAFHDEYKSTTCTNFLNQPIIRRFTDIIEVDYNNDPRRVKNAFEKALAELKTQMQANKVTIDAKVLSSSGEAAFPMESSEINNLAQEGRDLSKQLVFLNNFYAFYKAGNNLLKLYKRITPDSMDGLNLIGNIQAYKDTAVEFDAKFEEESKELSRETYFFGSDAAVNVTEQFVGEESIYGLERGYEKLMDTAMDVAKIFFPLRTSPAAMALKEKLKAASGSKSFTSAMHKLIDSNMMFLMMTSENSPFIKYLNQEHAASMYLSPSDNIYTQMQDLKKEFPSLETNAFLANIEKDFDPENKYYGIKFDSSFSFNKEEKQRFTNALKAMLFTPQIYLNGYTSDMKFENGVIADPELRAAANRIKKLGINLVMNTFLVNGFRQGSSSYADLIPIEYLSVKQNVNGELKSIADFLEDETLKMNDTNYFKPNDIINYMQLFGGMKADSIPLLDRVKNKGLTDASIILTSKNPNRFVFMYNPKTKKSAVFMNTGDMNKNGDYRFVRLDSLFKNKGVYTLGSSLNVGEKFSDEYTRGYTSGVEGLKKDLKTPDDTSMFESCSGSR